MGCRHDSGLCYRRHRFPPEIIQHAIWLYFWVASGFVIGSTLLVALYRYLPPRTPLMLLRRVEGYGIHKSWTSFDHISVNLVRAVIASEDTNRRETPTVLRQANHVPLWQRARANGVDEMVIRAVQAGGPNGLSGTGRYACRGEAECLPRENAGRSRCVIRVRRAAQLETGPQIARSRGARGGY